MAVELGDNIQQESSPSGLLLKAVSMVYILRVGGEILQYIVLSCRHARMDLRQRGRPSELAPAAQP